MCTGGTEVGDGPNHLVFPLALVPVDTGRWAPLEGQYYKLRGTAAAHTEGTVDPWRRTPPRLKPEKEGPVDKLWKIYDKTKTEPDAMRRHHMVWEMIKIHVNQGPFFSGSVANAPRVIVAKKELENVPARDNLAQHGFVNPWTVPSPAVYDPETYYWKSKEDKPG